METRGEIYVFQEWEWIFLKPFLWEMQQTPDVRTRSASPWRPTTTARTWRWSTTSSTTWRGLRVGSAYLWVTWWRGCTTTTIGKDTWRGYLNWFWNRQDKEPLYGSCFCPCSKQTQTKTACYLLLRLQILSILLKSFVIWNLNSVPETVQISCISILDSRANILSKQSSLLSSGSRGSGHESVVIDSHSDSRVSPVYRDINSFRPSLMWSIVNASNIVIERALWTLDLRPVAIIWG